MEGGWDHSTHLPHHHHRHHHLFPCPLLKSPINGPPCFLHRHFHHHHLHLHHHHFTPPFLCPFHSLFRHHLSSPPLPLHPTSQSAEPSASQPWLAEDQTVALHGALEGEEQEEEEEPVFVMTDEWMEFFAKSEAKRRLTKKKKKHKKANK